MPIAGKIMPRAMGEYSASTVYDVLDIVTYGEKPWICRKMNVVGVEPSIANAAYWQLLIDVDITNADTLDKHDSTYFATAEQLARITREPIQVTFAADGWSESAPYTQTVTADGMKSTDSPIPIFVDDGSDEDETKAKQKAYSCISYFDSGDGVVTATCKYNKPEKDFTVGLKGA